MAKTFKQFVIEMDNVTKYDSMGNPHRSKQELKDLKKQNKQQDKALYGKVSTDVATKLGLPKKYYKKD
jgi:hypothetical protein